MKIRKLVDVLTNRSSKDKKEIKSMEDFQARIVISILDYNNSVMILDENGESHTMPIPDPTCEEFFVKIGDKISEFEVLELTENFIVIKSFMEYTENNDSTPKNQFIIEKGNIINLNMYGLCDAVHRVSIEYIENVLSANI